MKHLIWFFLVLSMSVFAQENVTLSGCRDAYIKEVIPGTVNNLKGDRCDLGGVDNLHIVVFGGYSYMSADDLIALILNSNTFIEGELSLSDRLVAEVTKVWVKLGLSTTHFDIFIPLFSSLFYGDSVSVKVLAQPQPKCTFFELTHEYGLVQLLGIKNVSATNILNGTVYQYYLAYIDLENEQQLKLSNTELLLESYCALEFETEGVREALMPPSPIKLKEG
ncbi:hypothetical protein CWC22_021695 [Pseudoalteromonas rubra]|uniref:Uncharacterized protein n=1 Tax=Pseudoalteromonas rubra TaxID=43658 RepID=A0A7S8BNF8_9GAMM|nr:hypothetical protein [Pseudoalteromonas rubra]QPB85626.1 hypothetical protein CWC22_021695 [Pseudoalteromonas rubra]